MMSGGDGREYLLGERAGGGGCDGDDFYSSAKLMGATGSKGASCGQTQLPKARVFDTEDRAKMRAMIILRGL
jgi:hypothetical protein